MKLTTTRKSVLAQFMFTTVSRWAAIFGIVNILAVLVSLGYVFFILPTKASDEAQILLRQDMAAQTVSLRTTLDELNRLVGQANERANVSKAMTERLSKSQATAEENLEALQKRITVLDAQLQGVETSDPAAIARFVSDFNKNPDLKSLVTRVAAVERDLPTKISTSSQFKLLMVGTNNFIGHMEDRPYQPGISFLILRNEPNLLCKWKIVTE